MISDTLDTSPILLETYNDPLLEQAREEKEKKEDLKKKGKRGEKKGQSFS